jgi:hypothetical protein
MQFRAELTPAPLPGGIQYGQKLFLIGSCFTEEVGNKLIRHKFEVLQNPSGILFNPVSIADTVKSCVTGSVPGDEELFYHNELWHSWKHHSRFSNPDKEIMLSGIRDAVSRAHQFLKETDWVLITLGSAFVYEREKAASPSGRSVVANCHKVPADTFNRRLLSVEEVRIALSEMIMDIRSVNNKAKYIITISPVRHLREGFIDNNRSKAVLIQAVHGLCDTETVYYFPSFELVMDDLRDYRFYAEDLAHPNYAATQYVWEKFVNACMQEDAKSLMKEINQINAARRHKPFNPSSEAHKRFLSENLEKVSSLKRRFPFLALDEEVAYFTG